jgi:hypothetical protein
VTKGVRGVRQPIAGQSVVGNSGSVPAPAQQIGFSTLAGLLTPFLSASQAFRGLVRQIMPKGANPTAIAGPVAVNGSATTFMRSDGAPAVQTATAGQLGLVEPDGTTITISGGIISAVPSGLVIGSGVPAISEPSGTIYSRSDQAGAYAAVTSAGTAPSIDTTFSTSLKASYSSGSAYSGAWTNKAGGTNRTFVAVICYESTSGTPAVSSVTESSSTLAFTRHSTFTNTTSGAHNLTIEVWTATDTGTYNSGGASITWGVNWSSAIDDATIMVGCFQNVASLTAIWDTNASLPATAHNTSSTTPPTVTFSTSIAADMLFFISTVPFGYAPGNPVGWTQSWDQQNAGGSNYCYTQWCTKSVSALQSGATVADTSTSSSYWTAMVLALAGSTATSWDYIGPVYGTGSPTQSANVVLAGPTTGSAASPTFRALVAADLPAGTTPTGANPSATAGPAAVNGSAATFMRSDAAPAVQKASSSQFGIVEVDNTTITASGGVITAVQPAGANPSVTAGPAAVNGSATTFMRSDGAPAIQKASSSQFGIVEVDNTTILAASGIISAALNPLFFINMVGGTPQTIPNATQTQVTGFSTPAIDTASGWNATTQKYTVQTAGKYLILAQTHIAISGLPSAGWVVAAVVYKNVSNELAIAGVPGAVVTGTDQASTAAIAVASLSVNDVLLLEVVHTAGANETLPADAATYFALIRIGP